VNGVAYVRNMPKGNDMKGGYYHKNSVLGESVDLHSYILGGEKYVCKEMLSVAITPEVRDVLYHVDYIEPCPGPDSNFDPKPVQPESKSLMESAEGYEYVTLHEVEKVWFTLDGVYDNRFVAKIMSIGLIKCWVEYMIYVLMVFWMAYNLIWHRTNVLNKYNRSHLWSRLVGAVLGQHSIDSSL
jgi:hypothetical protein